MYLLDHLLIFYIQRFEIGLSLTHCEWIAKLQSTSLCVLLRLGKTWTLKESTAFQSSAKTS